MIHSDSLRKESTKEGALSRDTSKEKAGSGAGSLAQIFGKLNSQGSDPMMDRLFQNLKSLTEEGMQKVYGRSNTNTASVSAVESHRSMAQQLGYLREQPGQSQGGSIQAQRHAFGSNSESLRESQLSRRKSVANQLGKDRSTENSQRSIKPGSELGSLAHKLSENRSEVNQAKHPRTKTTPLGSNDQTNQRRKDDRRITAQGRADYDSSEIDKATVSSGMRPVGAQTRHQGSKMSEPKSPFRGSDRSRANHMQRSPKDRRSVSSSHSQTNRSRSRSKSPTASARSNVSTVLSKSGKAPRPPISKPKPSDSRPVQEPARRASLVRKSRVSGQTPDISVSPERRSLESSQHEALAGPRVEDFVIVKQKHANSSIHSAIDSSNILQAKGVHTKSLAGIGETQNPKARGPRATFIQPDNSSQRSWGFPSSQRLATGSTASRMNPAGSSTFRGQPMNSLDDEDASIDDFTQLEQQAEAETLAEQRSRRHQQSSQHSRPQMSRGAVGESVEEEMGEHDSDTSRDRDDCKRLTLLGRPPADSSLDESQDGNFGDPQHFDDEFEQYIPKNQDLFYIDDRGSHNESQSQKADQRSGWGMGPSLTVSGYSRKVSQSNMLGSASNPSGLDQNTNKRSFDYQGNGDTVRPTKHSLGQNMDLNVAHPSNVFSLGTPTVGHSVATVPSSVHPSPPVSTSQHKQSSNQTPQGTDQHVSGAEAAQSYVQCFHSTNMHLGGTIPELSQDREEEATEDHCYDSGGMYLNSHDKRLLLEKLKQNFEQNSCFDVEFLMTGKGEKQKARTGLHQQQYSSSSEQRAATPSHPSTQSKPNIFQGNWGDGPEEGDSLDIDDRRVLFESEVRKQIHRNAPFEETEDYARLELLHKLSKEHKALAKIDSVDTERSKITDLHSIEAADAHRFGGSSFDAARLNQTGQLFDPQTTLNLKEELSGVQFEPEKPSKPAAKPRVTEVSVGLVEPLNIQNPAASRAPQPQTDLHSFRQKLDSSRPGHTKSIDEVKLSVSSPNPKHNLEPSQDRTEVLSISGRSNQSRGRAARKPAKQVAAEPSRNKTQQSPCSNKSLSSRSRGSRRTNRHKVGDHADDKDDKLTVRTLRSGGEKQIEELRNMFFDSNPEDLQGNIKAPAQDKQTRGSNKPAVKNGGILESFGEEDENLKDYPQLEVSLHHPEVDESHTASAKGSKSKRSAMQGSRQINLKNSLHLEDDQGNEFTDQVSQSGYSMVSAHHADLPFDRSKPGKSNPRQLPRNSTAAHIFAGPAKPHVESLGVEVSHHVQSVSTHKKPKAGLPMGSWIKPTKQGFAQRASVNAPDHSIHVSMEFEAYEHKEVSEAQGDSGAISLVELPDERSQLSPVKRRPEARAHQHDSKLKGLDGKQSKEQSFVSRSQGFAGLIERLNGSSDSGDLQSYHEHASVQSKDKSRDFFEHSPKILPRPILKQVTSVESEMSEEDRQLKELTDYYMGVGTSEPSMIQPPSRASAGTFTKEEHQPSGKPKVHLSKQQQAMHVNASDKLDNSLSLQFGGTSANHSSPTRARRLQRDPVLATETGGKESRADSSIPTLSGAKGVSRDNTAKKRHKHMLKNSIEGLDAAKEAHTRFYGPGMTSSSGFFSMKEENPFPSGTMEEEYLLENLTEILGGNEATPGLTHEKTSGRGENSSVSKPKRGMEDRWKIHKISDNRQSRSGSKEDRIEVMQKIIYQLEEENRILKSKAFPQFQEESPGHRPGSQISTQKGTQRGFAPSQGHNYQQDMAGLSHSQDSKENVYFQHNTDQDSYGWKDSRQEYLKVENMSSLSAKPSKATRNSKKSPKGSHTRPGSSIDSQEQRVSRLYDLQTANQPVVVQTFKSLVDHFPQAGYVHLHLGRRTHRKPPALDR